MLRAKPSPRSVHDKSIKVVGQALSRLGYQSKAFFNELEMEKWNPDRVIMWNGETAKDKAAAKRIEGRGIEVNYMELGHFGQGQNAFLSKHGSVGANLFRDEEIEIISPQQDRMLNHYFFQYSRGRKKNPGSHVLVMLQLENDYAILNHGAIKSMQALVNKVHEMFPEDEVRIKTHPLDRKKKLETDGIIIRGGSIWDHMMSAKIVVGLNSTSLYESVLAGIQTLSFGNCPLAGADRKRQRSIVYEMISRQLPLSGSTDLPERAAVSLGIHKGGSEYYGQVRSLPTAGQI